ncbi:hypothetical protein ACFX11_038383 [Malus domestica]
MRNRRFAQVTTSDDEDDDVVPRSHQQSAGDTSSRKRKQVKLREGDDEESGEEEKQRSKKKRRGKEKEAETASGSEDEEEEPHVVEDAKPIGEVVKLSGKGRGRRQHYKAFEYDGTRFDLEDPVLLTPEDTKQKPYVAIIKVHAL